MRPDTFPLFTYGTLQYADVFEAVTGRSFPSVPARLPDYRRFLVRDQVYPGAVSDPGASVEGRLYPAVDAALLGPLDRFEGPLYERRSVAVVLTDGARPQAEVYVIPDRFRDRLAPTDWDATRFEQAYQASYVRSTRTSRIADTASGDALRRARRPGL